MIQIRGVCIWLVMLCSITHVESLQCYLCADTGADNLCEQYETFVEAFDGKRPQVAKNCTAPYDQVCYIETFSSGGIQVSHIRDCGDGNLFSFSYNDNTNNGGNKSVYKRLYELGDNNETACVYTGQQQVCLSKCSSDFCNGPFQTDVNQASVLSFSLHIFMFLFIVSLLL